MGVAEILAMLNWVDDGEERALEISLPDGRSLGVFRNSADALTALEVARVVFGHVRLTRMEIAE